MMTFLLKIFMFLLGCYNAASSCPDGWSSYGSSCYHFSEDKEVWATAMSLCHILGGNIVEIKDGPENNYLVSQAQHFNQSYWIGLNDLQEEGTWVWINSNTPLSYSNWARGQPDNDRNNENCAVIHKGFNYVWNDVPCSQFFNYICERNHVDTDIIG